MSIVLLETGIHTAQAHLTSKPRQIRSSSQHHATSIIEAISCALTYSLTRDSLDSSQLLTPSLKILPCILAMFSNLLTVLHHSVSPYIFLAVPKRGKELLTLYNTKGIGMNAIERNPNVELAHAIPRLLYIAVAKSGNPAPKLLLMKSLPASTLAAYSGYASGR